MDAKAEAEALMTGVGGPRWTSGPVPPKLAPLLKALADCAKERGGKGLPFERLQEVVQAKTSERRGRIVLRRWIREAGGEPWFQGK